MNTQAVVVPLAALCWLLSSCGPESSGAPTQDHGSHGAGGHAGHGAHPADGGSSEPEPLARDHVAAVWPETGSKVFTALDLNVGGGEKIVNGRIAVLAGGEPIPAGTAVAAGDGVTLFAPGRNHGTLALDPGKVDLVVQVLDEAGKSLGPDMAAVVSYDVVEAPASARVFFVEPSDGATVKAPFKVVFGVEGMGMSPALENILDKTVGHHHVIVNGAAVAPSWVIPADATHLHYGKAQTEAEIALEPGDYTLMMQFADGNHRSYGPRLASKAIRVTVE